MLSFIKQEHLPLIEKIAKETVEKEWDDSQLLSNFVNATLDVGNGNMDSDAIKAFDNFADITNLISITNLHYNAEMICQKLIQYRNKRSK